MVHLCTGFTMLPLHRNDGIEPKRRLAYADFYRTQIVAKNIWVGRQTGGSVGFSETRFFFFSNDKDFYSCCFISALKVLFQGS